MKIIPRNSLKYYKYISLRAPQRIPFFWSQWNSIVDDVRWMKEEAKKFRRNIYCFSWSVFRSDSDFELFRVSASISPCTALLCCCLKSQHWLSCSELCGAKQREKDEEEAARTTAQQRKAADNLIDCFLCLIYLLQTMANEPCIRGGFTFLLMFISWKNNARIFEMFLTSSPASYFTYCCAAASSLFFSFHGITRERRERRKMRFLATKQQSTHEYSFN